jgi:hypothetical protein
MLRTYGTRLTTGLFFTQVLRLTAHSDWRS